MNKDKIPCLIFSRVVGYYSYVQGWNKGKQSEYSERKVFDTKQIISKHKL